MGEQRCFPEPEWLREFLAFFRLLAEDDAKMQHEICYS